ncbi:CYCU4-1 [Symbiodinium necroappetens]|uniref:CYCU4-1 protein n=1 Tax=Symbiodinium necroappetens TaxID=1628268 RepID=A0A813AMH3_9DINO|nr:CYCU4-1 [Symbiodinium necroappetens]
MDVGKLCKALASVYSSFIEVENGRQDMVSRFHSKVAPGIGIEQYLTRLAKYFQCHESCLLLALVYIDRAVKMNPVVVVNNFTIHRLLAVSTVLAAKVQDDLFFSNAHYARVCGLTLRELNSLEVYFTSLLRWKLHVPVTEYREYLNMVKRVA